MFSWILDKPLKNLRVMTIYFGIVSEFLFYMGEQKKGSIQILFDNSALRYAIALSCGRNATSIALNYHIFAT